MTKREKALNGLECCACPSGACGICPYFKDRSEPCVTIMAADVLELLKEQQETIASLQSTISKLTQSIEEQPGQRHGHWQITEFFPHNVCCSLCHHRFAQTHWDAWESGQLPRKYCPNCGAKMDGRW